MSSSITFVWHCDRCGREQHGNYDPRAAEQEFPVQWERVTRHYSRNNTLTVELCRECSEGFAAWLFTDVTGTTAPATIAGRVLQAAGIEVYDLEPTVRPEVDE